MRTFLLDEIFQPNRDCQVSKQLIGGEGPAVICEDTLAHLNQVRELVQSSPAANWKHQPNGKNFIDYKDCRVRYPVMAPLSLWQLAINIVRQAYDKKTVPGVDDLDVNCFFQINERRTDTSFVHEDVYAEAQLFTCLLYLNSAPECNGGTAFYRNLTFGQATSPSNDSIERFYDDHPHMLEDGRDYWPVGWEQHYDRLGVIDMVPGRMLIFPGRYFHAAYHPQGWFFDFPRMTVAFWLRILQ